MNDWHETILERKFLTYDELNLLRKLREKY
jgi:hypothetical protein